jgi:virulence-associated protein VagC
MRGEGRGSGSQLCVVCALWQGYPALQRARVKVGVSGFQAVRLPEEFRFDSDTVTIRREGEAVVLDAAKPAARPEGFFEAIRVEDPRFARPDPGAAPAVPALD